MLTVNADKYQVTWDNILSMWQVSKVGSIGDEVYARKLRLMSGESVVFCDVDGVKRKPLPKQA